MKPICKCGHYMGIHDTQGCFAFDLEHSKCDCKGYNEGGETS